jgi:hypothetical protein
MNEQKKQFTTWLIDKNMPDGEIIEQRTMKMLASDPLINVTSWQAYDINGYTFYAKAKDKKNVTGIHIEVFDPQGLKTTYYGYIEDIWKLDYDDRMQIPTFMC